MFDQDGQKTPIAPACKRTLGLSMQQRVNNLQENAKGYFFDAIFPVLVKDSAISLYLFIVLIYVI